MRCIYIPRRWLNPAALWLVHKLMARTVVICNLKKNISKVLESRKPKFLKDDVKNVDVCVSCYGVCRVFVQYYKFNLCCGIRLVEVDPADWTAGRSR